MEEEDPVEAQTIIFSTKEYRNEDLRPRYLKKEMEFFPCDDECWTFENVQLFLNSLPDFDAPKRSHYYKRSFEPYFTLKFYKIDDEKFTINFMYSLKQHR